MLFKFFTWSRLVEPPSSDEMKLFYAEHDFQIDLEKSEFTLKFHEKRIGYNINIYNLFLSLICIGLPTADTCDKSVEKCYCLINSHIDGNAPKPPISIFDENEIFAEMCF